VYLIPSLYLCSHCLFALFDILVRQWGSKAKNDPVLVLNAKEREIKAKAKWISQPLVNFENRRIRICFVSKSSYYKIWSLMGENIDYGKRGSFWHLINFTRGISLYLLKQVCLT
jgi:hypothetical protein